jgi:hypothetical protein
MGEQRPSQERSAPVSHPAAPFINSLHDGLRCCICALTIEHNQRITSLDGEKVYSATEPDFTGPIRIVYHPGCMKDGVVVH